MEILEELGKDLPLDEVCPICICPLYDFVHTTETLSCLHKYHTQCLKQSWEYHYKNKILQVCILDAEIYPCPICRCVVQIYYPLYTLKLSKNDKKKRYGILQMLDRLNIYIEWRQFVEEQILKLYTRGQGNAVLPFLPFI